jgi:hypothetical protein
MTILATDEQTKQAQNLLNTALSQQEDSGKLGNAKIRVYTFMLASIIVASYITIVWDVMQPAISPIIFVSALSIAIACSVVLGRTLSRRSLRVYHDTR